MGIYDKIAAVFSDAAAERSARSRARRAYYDNTTPVVQRMMNSYGGAMQTRLSTPWSRGYGQGFGINRYRLFEESYIDMVSRSRSLEMNNPLASAILDRSAENVIGTGIQFRAASVEPTFNEQADAYVARVTRSKNLDVRGMFTTGELQRLFYRAKKRDGRVGMLLIDQGGEPKLQIIEGDQLQNTPSSNPSMTFDGVQLGPDGKPVQFWLYEYDLATGMATPRGVDPRDFIYYNQTTSYNDLCGVPSFYGSYDLFDQLWGVLEALAVAWRAGACQALIFLRRNAGADYDAQNKDVKDSQGVEARSYPLEPGQINVLDAAAGEDVKGFTPTQPTQSMPDLLDAFAGVIGLKFGLTIDQVLLKFKGMNYSVSRAAKLQAWATADIEQENFISTFGDRFYPWVVSKGIKNGAIKAKPPADYFAYEWIPPARPLVGPESDMNAAIKAISLGVDARSYVATALGFKWKDLVRRNKSDMDDLKAAGLPTELNINPQGLSPDQNTGAKSQ